MYKRFQALPLWGRIVVVMITLVAAGFVLQLVVGLLKALIPLAIVAAVIVGALWIFDKARGG